MVRLFLLLVFVLAWPTISSTDHGARDPLTRAHDAAIADAERLGPLVAARFALYAGLQRCGQSDNLYAFNFALKRFKPSERFLLQRAAADGWRDGADKVAGPCDAGIDQLRAADDALLARAELLPDRG